MDEDDVWFRSPEPLGVPLALMAFVVGLFACDFARSVHYLFDRICLDAIGDHFRVSRAEWPARVLLASASAVAFGIAGRVVSRRITNGAPPIRTMLVALMGAAGALAAVIGLVTLGQGFGLGIVLGSVIGVVSVPFAVLLARNAGWAWRARVDSVLHATYRRARWIDLATAVTVSLAFYANPVFGAAYRTEGRREIAWLLVLGATMLALASVLGAVASLVRVGRASMRFGDEGAADAGDASGLVDVNAEVVDLGLGDERRRDVARAASAYRHQAKVLAVCVGDLRRAWRVVGFAVARSVTIVAVGAVVLTTHVRMGPIQFVDQCLL